MTDINGNFRRGRQLKRSNSRSGATAAALAATVMILASGCGIGSDSAEDAAESFATALFDRNFADAFELTTARESDFACDWMRSNNPQAAGIEDRPAIEIDDVDVSGRTAEVEARLLGDPVVPLTLSLEQSGGEWLVEIPSDWSLDVAFDGPTVLQASVGDCLLADASTSTSTFTWPLLHFIDVTDPSGVLRDHNGGRMVVSEPTAVSIPAIPDSAVESVQSPVRQILSREWQACVESGLEGTLTSPSCPAEIQGETTQITDVDDYSDSVTVERLWPDDDAELWRFETSEANALLTPESGEESSVPFRYSGTLDTVSSGSLIVNLDE